MELGARAEAGGDFASAERAYRQVLAEDGSNRDAKLRLALLYGNTGRIDDSLKLLRELGQGEPVDREAVRLLGDLLRHIGRFDEAVASFRGLIELDPKDAAAHAGLGRCYLSTRQLPLAEDCFADASRLDPANGSYPFFLGEALVMQGKNAEAMTAYERAAELDPNIPPAFTKRAQLLLDMGKREEAIAVCAAALERHPGLGEARVIWAEALFELGRAEEAEAQLRLAESADPQAAVAFGFRLQVLGRFEDARGLFERALQRNPRMARAYYGLAVGSRATEADLPRVTQMKSLLRDPGLRPMDRVVLHFGLGKMYDDLKDFKSAMQHYDEANGTAARVLNLPFDGKRLASINDWRIRTYSRSTIEKFAAFGSDSERPIFVIGMIRSGTTLVEQVLSNHPEIAGGGEQRFWSEKEGLINRGVSDETLDAGQVRELAGQYLDLLRDIAPDKRYVIDKMPLNFSFLGMMHMLFPKARIIHCRRSPIDTCLSIYTTFFDSSPPFAHDPENIIFYYRQYERLMSHWQRVLPKGSMLEVRYEDMVADPTKTIGEILAFCGLEWDEAVMHPELNQRSVRTPSYWQVRQPVYPTSVERWRKYEGWLGEFEGMKNDL